MQQLSVIIITYNEERNIYRCIDSVRDIADEIIVLDSYSKDETVAIAKELGAKTYLRHFSDYVSQRNHSMQLATHDWVFVIDADEVLSAELAQSIRQALAVPVSDAYECNRLTNYCGRWVNHCGWYPDRKLRLMNRRAGKWEGQLVHEYWARNEQQQPVARLKGDLLHYSYNSMSEH